MIKNHALVGKYIKYMINPYLYYNQNIVDDQVISINSLFKEYFEPTKIAGLTAEQVNQLKPGNRLKDLSSGEEIIVEEFELNEYNGKPIIYLMKKSITGNALALPYYYNELELISDISKEKCTCDIMVLMRIGCQCKGK